MSSKISLTLVDGARIVVPDSLDRLTPYVLQEQGDWFEDEIKFLRCFLLPGHNVIDIGANFGVYTLSMAKAVGDAGHVWAFEPASKTAGFLRDGVAANDFQNVTIEQKGLSNVSGTAELSLHDNPEFNSLANKEKPGASPNYETVDIVTLDEFWDFDNEQRVTFVKIDAEGEEANVIRGGSRFFTNQSPLIQYEIKASDNVQMELVSEFSAKGYRSYRLVVGLQILVPFDIDSPYDPSLLNLFCCKPDCADGLETRNILTQDVPDTSAKRDHCVQAAWDRLDRDRTQFLRDYFAALPYAQKLLPAWENAAKSPEYQEVEEPLAAYVLSLSTDLSARERFAALESSYLQFKSLTNKQPSRMRLASFARIAEAYGARTVALSALNQLGALIKQTQGADLSEPFITPAPRFDLIDPGQEMHNWVISSVLEGMERNSGYSSYNTGKRALGRLENLCRLGFSGEEMPRRLALIKKRFGLND